MLSQHSLQDAEPLTNRGHRPMASGGAALDNNDQRLLRIMSKRRSCASARKQTALSGANRGRGSTCLGHCPRLRFFNCLNPEQHRVSHVEPTLTLHLLKCCIYATRTDNCSFTDWMHSMARQPKMVPIRDLGGIRQCLNF